MSFYGKETVLPSAAVPELSDGELRSVIATYLIGRQLKIVPQFGALGRLVQNISRDGIVHKIGDVVVDVSSGDSEAAALRLRHLVFKGQKQTALQKDILANITTLSHIGKSKKQV